RGCDFDRAGGAGRLPRPGRAGVRGEQRGVRDHLAGGDRTPRPRAAERSGAGDRPPPGRQGIRARGGRAGDPGAGAGDRRGGATMNRRRGSRTARGRLLLLLLLLAVTLLGTAGVARAGDDSAGDSTGTPPSPPHEPAQQPQQYGSSASPAGGKRVLPDYAGRPAAPPSAREAFLWVPRALLLPAQLTSEYVLRRPVVAFVRWGDEHYVFRRVYDFFTWADGQGGVYPIASFDLGLKSTVGVALVDRSLLSGDSSLRASVSASTQDVFSTSARECLRILRGGTGALCLGGHFVRRPDGIFHGLGPDTLSADKVFYAYQARGLA